jgi:hypothetical protein
MPSAAEIAREYSVHIVDLSTDSQDAIVDAVSNARETGTLDQLDVREMVVDAAAAEFHSAQAEDYQREQTKAADAGNWDLARDYAQKANYEREAAADNGAAEAPVVESERDVSNLDNARTEQRLANENAATSADYARYGDVANAAVYGDVAAQHQTLADESAHSGTLAADSATDTKHEAETPEHAPDEAAAASSASALPDTAPEPTPEG